MPILTALAPERDSFVANATFSGTVTVRKSANALTPQEISDYRLAVHRIAQISAKVATDDRGYQWIAGIHGMPQRKCKHGRPAFALWHRPYVQMFEQALQDVVPTAFLPYWNWTRDLAVPQIYLDRTWKNPDTGKTEPNPLLGQPMHGGALTKRHPKAGRRLARQPAPGLAGAARDRLRRLLGRPREPAQQRARLGRRRHGQHPDARRSTRSSGPTTASSSTSSASGRTRTRRRPSRSTSRPRT